MSRNILVVDHSGTIRRILRTMILANINDAEVAEAPDTAKAMHKLAEGNTHLVLFSWESADAPWFDFIKKVKTESGSERLNFVLFTSRPDDKRLARMKEAGVAAQLIIPCTPATLTETVNRACNPTLLRESRRYSIPGASAILSQGAISLSAKVINISLGGMLCELPLPERIDWSVPLLATVSFPGNGQPLVAANLFSVTSSFFVQESRPDHTPKLIRIAMRFINPPAAAAATLDAVFLNAADLERIESD